MSLIGIICMPDGPGCGSAGTESCLNVFTCLPFPCLLSDLVSFVHCFLFLPVMSDILRLYPTD